MHISSLEMGTNRANESTSTAPTKKWPRIQLTPIFNGMTVEAVKMELEKKNTSMAGTDGRSKVLGPLPVSFPFEETPSTADCSGEGDEGDAQDEGDDGAYGAVGAGGAGGNGVILVRMKNDDNGDKCGSGDNGDDVDDGNNGNNKEATNDVMVEDASSNGRKQTKGKKRTLFTTNFKTNSTTATLNNSTAATATNATIGTNKRQKQKDAAASSKSAKATKSTYAPHANKATKMAKSAKIPQISKAYKISKASKVAKSSIAAKSAQSSKLVAMSKHSISKSTGASTTAHRIPLFHQVVASLSKDEILRMADVRYSMVLSLNGSSTMDVDLESSNSTNSTITKAASTSATSSSSTNSNLVHVENSISTVDIASTSSKTIHAVTSSLSDKEMDLLSTLCEVLKTKKVFLKITKDFLPGKTQLCITSANEASSKNEKIEKVVEIREIHAISSHRTLKIMRSVLAGIPIVTPQWMEACLKEMKAIPPVGGGGMCVRTVPMKPMKPMNPTKQNNPSEMVGSVGSDDDRVGHENRFGVAKYAAAFYHRPLSSTDSTVSATNSRPTSNLLSGISVMLCGSWKNNVQMKRDLKYLVEDAGATIITSVSSATQTLSEMSNQSIENDCSSNVTTKFVFLCDDSLSDVECNISNALFHEAKVIAMDHAGTVGNAGNAVMAVSFVWLFDCISCAALMPASAYEPLAPRAKELWRLGL